MEQVWDFLNSPIGLLIVTAAIGWAVKAIAFKKPAWSAIIDKYKGDLIAAVKYAEKAIPDDSPNKSMKRLDEALKYMLKVDSTLASPDIKQAIEIVHAEIE